MKIGELAQATDTQTETIRYYERQGLLPEPVRTSSNYRVYEDRHAERLAFIRHCRALDMTLDEIRALLHFKDAPTENCEDVNGLLDEHIEHVVSRIRELTELEKHLRSLRKQCAVGRAAASCGILSGLDKGARGRGHVPGTHLGGAHAGLHTAKGSSGKRRGATR